jgi:hypothetical protein
MIFEGKSKKCRECSEQKKKSQAYESLPLGSGMGRDGGACWSGCIGVENCELPGDWRLRSQKARREVGCCCFGWLDCLHELGIRTEETLAVEVDHIIKGLSLGHCHAACGEAAPPPALFEDERLRVLGDAFQQFDVSPVAGFVDRLGE